MEPGEAMPKKIKLENIIGKRKEHRHSVSPENATFCPQCGEKVVEDAIVEEFVCENCRNLVKQEDAFCWYCDSPLESSSVVEHWHQGKKLTKKEFSKRKRTLKA